MLDVDLIEANRLISNYIGVTQSNNTQPTLQSIALFELLVSKKAF